MRPANAFSGLLVEGLGLKCLPEFILHSPLVAHSSPDAEQFLKDIRLQDVGNWDGLFYSFTSWPDKT